MNNEYKNQLLKRLEELLFKQLNTFFPLSRKEKKVIANNIEISLERSINCFSKVKEYIDENGNVVINPYYSRQYAVIIYYLSNQLHLMNEECKDKIFLLNKIINNIEINYKIDTIKPFLIGHTNGIIVGRAKLGSNLFLGHNVTIGHNNSFYPTFADNVSILFNASIIGKSSIGSNTIISSNCYIKDEDIPPCSIVFGESPNLIVKRKTLQYFNERSLFII